MTKPPDPVGSVLWDSLVLDPSRQLKQISQRLWTEGWKYIFLLIVEVLIGFQLHTFFPFEFRPVVLCCQPLAATGKPSACLLSVFLPHGGDETVNEPFTNKQAGSFSNQWEQHVPHWRRRGSFSLCFSQRLFLSWRLTLCPRQPRADQEFLQRQNGRGGGRWRPHGYFGPLSRGHHAPGTGRQIRNK